MTQERQILAAEEVEELIRRMALEIVQRFTGDYALVGIHEQGVPLAQRLCDNIEKCTGRRPDFAELDITMYRDDIGNRSRLPKIRETNIPFDVNDKQILLVDDVLSSGRTIRAALDALTDYGRPGMIRLAVLIDRGNPEFPIRADIIGKRIRLDSRQKILVRFQEDSCGVFAADWQNK